MTYHDFDSDEWRSPSICCDCVKRKGITEETRQVILIADMMDAGFTVTDSGAFPLEVWRAVALVRRERNAVSAMAGMMSG